MRSGSVIPFPASPVSVEPSSGTMLHGLGNGLAGSVAAQVEVETDTGDVVRVMDDGSVEIEAPAVITHDWSDDDFGANLAERIDDGILQNIADEINQGIESDIASRSELIANGEKGIDLLGLKIDEAGSTRGQVRAISKVGHPLLLEALVKYWASFVGEMLPASGPAKVPTIGQVSTKEEELAQDFESDLNYFLTEIATEYYPDTGRLPVQQGFYGNAYKKIFRCPMRDRPVSESVSMVDLIVSEDASDLQGAQRVTHQFFPTRSMVRRMQIAGRYRDVDLGQPMLQLPPGNLAVKRSEGMGAMYMRPQDMPYHFYETDTDIDTSFYDIRGKYEDAAPWGLPLPYKVTFDKDGKQVLGIWRNWKQGDELYRKRNMYVKYGLVPGLGFHDWGFLHLLGNQTRALRAIWRLLIDAGMFSNFPGGVKLKSARTSTNEIAPGPGEWVDIDISAVQDIRQVLMALPYGKIDAMFVQLAQMIEQGAMRLGGTVQLETGEGRTNVPVGTIMSQIEQQTQTMAAVHKGNHRSQKEELCKLRDLFVENPEDLWRLARDPKRRWQVGEEFADLNLVPASDPNVPAQMHRIMRAWALGMVAMQPQNQGIYDVMEVNRRILSALREPDPDTLLLSPEQMAQQAAAQMQQQAAPGQAPPDPSKMAAVQQKAQQETQRAQERMAEMQLDAQTKERDRQLQAQAAALESADRAADRASRERVAAMREQTEHERLAGEMEKQRQEQAQQGMGEAHPAPVVPEHVMDALGSAMPFGGEE